jgi:AraC-like DNA-binding protein
MTAILTASMSAQDGSLGFFPLLASNDPGTGVLFTRIRGAVPGRLAFGPLDGDSVSVLASPARASQMECALGRVSGQCRLNRGDALVADMRQLPSLRCGDSVDLVRVDIPRPALEIFAKTHGWDDLPELAIGGCGNRDATLSALLGSLEPYFDKPREGGALVVNQIAMAVMAHLLSAYPHQDDDPQVQRGGLASWQERRIKELIDANLNADISIAWLAEQCGLSSSYFSRAFRESVGMPPYQWLIERRVSRAKALLSDRGRSLTDIALSSGFADQSHFSRVFARVTGMPPGVWRRTEMEP